MNKIKVAILGSCVSRDPFSFVQSPAFAVDQYVARTSLISLVAPPITIDYDAFQLEPAFEKRSVFNDFTKRSLSILETDADLVVVDFIDERFDLVLTQSSVALCTPNVQQCGVLSQIGGHSVLPRIDPKVASMWAEACRAFCSMVRQRGLRDRVVLHRAKYVQAYRDGDALKPYDPWKIKFATDQSVLIQTYHEQFIAELGLTDIIDVESRFCIGDQAHPWGLQPFHYASEYYREFMTQLAVIADRRGVRERAVQPTIQMS